MQESNCPSIPKWGNPRVSIFQCADWPLRLFGRKTLVTWRAKRNGSERESSGSVLKAMLFQ